VSVQVQTNWPCRLGSRLMERVVKMLEREVFGESESGKGDGLTN
jgi:hypothetical protein